MHGSTNGSAKAPTDLYIQHFNGLENSIAAPTRNWLGETVQEGPYA
jgi:hypothetical protein